MDQSLNSLWAEVNSKDWWPNYSILCPLIHSIFSTEYLCVSDFDHADAEPHLGWLTLRLAIAKQSRHPKLPWHRTSSARSWSSSAWFLSLRVRQNWSNQMIRGNLGLAWRRCDRDTLECKFSGSYGQSCYRKSVSTVSWLRFSESLSQARRCIGSMMGSGKKIQACKSQSLFLCLQFQLSTNLQISICKFENIQKFDQEILSSAKYSVVYLSTHCLSLYMFGQLSVQRKEMLSAGRQVL